MGVSFVRTMRVLSLPILLCLAASAHGFFGKLLAKKKEASKSCRTEELTSYSTEYSTQCDNAVGEVCSTEYEEECADKQVSRYEEECHDEVVSQPQQSCKAGGYNQVCQAGHDVTYERRCSKTCKEKKEKEKGPLKSLISGIKEKVVGVISLLKAEKEEECEETCNKVEVGRTPSMKCHNEKLAGVRTTEYKDTTVKKCKPVEKLESQRVCQKVPRRVCRQEPGKVCRQVGRQIPQTTSVRVCN